VLAFMGWINRRNYKDMARAGHLILPICALETRNATRSSGVSDLRDRSTSTGHWPP